MTEAEWLACESPLEMLRSQEGTLHHRKLLLFACACLRRIRAYMEKAEVTGEVCACEDFADGLVSGDDLANLERRQSELARAWDSTDLEYEVLPTLLGLSDVQSAYEFCWATIRCMMSMYVKGRYRLPEHDYAARIELKQTVGDLIVAEGKSQAALLRDIFGNPFRPVALDLAWRTSTAVALASQLYESRDFSAMPILADALQDAGCDNDDILNHCRDANAPHVRGCWVVDLVLGKA